MRRPLLGLLLLCVSIPVAGWLLLERQAQTLGEGLVADAQALEARHFELPGEPGEVFACAGAEADRAPDVSRTAPWIRPDVRAVTDGTAGLSPALRQALAEHHAWLERTSQCARGSTVQPTAGLGPFADLRHGRRQSMPRLMEALSSLAPLELRARLERGEPERALALCADVLTLAVGWLRLEGLEAMLPTLGPSRAVVPACHDALKASSPEAVAAFRARLQQVRALAPGFPEVMAVERTQLGLRLFGAWLPGELDVQLPASARLMTATQRATRFDRGVAATFALRLYWRRFDAGMRDVERAAALPPSAREVAIVAAQARLSRPLLGRFLAVEPVDLRYQMYAVYLDQLQQSLDALGAPEPAQ